MYLVFAILLSYSSLASFSLCKTSISHSVNEWMNGLDGWVDEWMHECMIQNEQITKHE